MPIEIITSPPLSAIENLLHGFTTRSGGVSTKSYASLNLGFSIGDEDESVEKNYDLLCAQLGVPLESIAHTRQVHGKECILVDKKTDLEELSVASADIMITREPGIFLGVRTADCLPIFVVDTKQKWLANVHAGWRGTLDGALHNALQIMIQKLEAKASDLLVAIGPGISLRHFEVSLGVSNLFKESKSLLPQEIVEKENSAFLDLAGINARQAVECGVPKSNIWKSNLCTFADSKKFFSYRRDGKDTGRNLGLIGWKQ